jgi:hypothetical protein
MGGLPDNATCAFKILTYIITRLSETSAVSPRFATVHLYDLRLHNFMFEKAELRVYHPLKELVRNLIKEESTKQYQHTGITMYT